MARMEPTRTSGTAVRGGLLCLLTAGAIGCSAPPELEAVTVLQDAQCDGLEAGLSLTSYDGLARIRGASLLSPAGRDEAGSGSEAQAQAQPRSHEEPLLVAVYKGPQPTAGYALTLESATLEQGTAVLRFRWETPPQNTLQAQVITHPCIVVALPRGPVRKVRALDQADHVLGSLQVPAD